MTQGVAAGVEHRERRFAQHDHVAVGDHLVGRGPDPLDLGRTDDGAAGRSLDLGVAAGVVGAMVAELPTGAQAGLGARLLTGSYYGNTVGIWSALVMSALLGAGLTAAVAGVERLVLRRGRAG
jgi:hypothetical protein